MNLYNQPGNPSFGLCFEKCKSEKSPKKFMVMVTVLHHRSLIVSFLNNQFRHAFKNNY